MTSRFLRSFFHARPRTLALAALLGSVGLTFTSSARATASNFNPANVVQNDTYSIEVVGYNTASPATNIYLIDPSLAPTFGTTAAYAGRALGDQTLTISSTEFISNGVVTDFITLSVPNNFVPTGTRDNAGNILNAIQFSFGNYLGGTNPLNFSPALSTYNVSTAVTFTVNGVVTSFPGGATSTLANGGTSPRRSGR